MTTGLWVLLAALLLVVAVGAWRRWSDGRFRVRGDGGSAASGEGAATAPTGGQRGEPDASDEPGLALVRAAGAELGEQATLVQFSSAFCAPCRATRHVLDQVTEMVPGVRHVEIDAEENLSLVRAAGVTRTPTTLVLDASGHEVSRAAGAPTKEQVVRALAATT